MNKFIFLLILMYSESVFSLEIIAVKNAQLKDLYLYNGSRLIVHPEEGVIVSVKGNANKRVKFEINKSSNLYLTPGVKITNLAAKNSIITLNKYGEGEFAIGFSLLGERHVSGKYKKPISYKVNYVD
jgi:hypothetical protein